MKFSRVILAAATVAALSTAATVSANAGAHSGDPVVSVWWNVKKTAKITISPCDDSVCGNITWMNEPNREDGTPKLDVNNDEEELRGRTILGMQIIGGFEREEAGEWDDGEIYNPEDGNTYSSNMKINDDGNLEVEGCVLFICKEQIWEPVKE
jgi:uncharacterized protein (DUF2147 family)